MKRFFAALAVCAAAPVHANHPLVSEDTGVLGKGGWQLELHGERVASGRGDAAVSLKWRFYEKDGFSMVFKPDLFLPTGRDEIGLGSGRLRWAANFAAAYETAGSSCSATPAIRTIATASASAARCGTCPRPCYGPRRKS